MSTTRAGASNNPRPVVCYDASRLPTPDLEAYARHRARARLSRELLVPPRSGATFAVQRGDFFRIVAVEGPQVGDLNLWHRDNLQEHFYSGKIRALHGTHLGVGDRMWSNFPHLRPMATITADSLSWYGYDADGAGVHDVIGTRCDPYTFSLLNPGQSYDYCCHSNLTRALAEHLDTSFARAESHVHDVLNVFMCTGFSQDQHQYFMKASPVRPGDYLEFYAEIDLLAALSACPGGDCSSTHSSDQAACYPLRVEIWSPGA